jgi:hypothetical protein
MLTPKIKNEDWTSVRQAISKLYTKLGPVAAPTFSGLTLTDLVTGSVIFAGSGGVISQDNDNFFWSGNTLGIGTNGTADDSLIGQMHVQSALTAEITFDSFRAEGSGDLGSIFRFRRSNHNTKGTIVETVDGQWLGTLYFAGVNSDGGFTNSASITAIQDGAAGATRLSAGLVFSVSTIALGLGEIFRVTPDGLKVGGTVTLKEQAAADGDTAAYSQIWAKIASPSELWHTDDTGVNTQIAPQDLRMSASPTFAGLDINGTTETDRLLVG